MRSMYCEKGYLEIIQPYYIVLFICYVLINFSRFETSHLIFIHVNCNSIALIRYSFFIKGIYQWGYDIQSNDTAIESNLDIFCRTNGLYNGSSIIDQQRIAGVSKKLISFTIDVKIPIWGLECIYRNGNIVGYVRRGDFGYKINKSIGTAYICRDYDCPIGDSYLNIGAYHIKLFGKMYPIQLRFN